MSPAKPGRDPLSPRGAAPVSAVVELVELARQVQSWQRQGHAVALARLVDTRGFSSRERVAIVAQPPGGPLVGSLLSGVFDRQLRQRLSQPVTGAELIELVADDADANRVGLSCGGVARLLVQPATDLAIVASAAETGEADLWSAILAREPSGLITGLDGDQPGTTHVFTVDSLPVVEQRYGPGVRRLFARGVSQTSLLTGAGPPGEPQRAAIVTTFWPVPSLLVVGEGQIAVALAATADLLGWTAMVLNDVDAAIAAVAALSRADAIVVLSHDRRVDGPVLKAALGAHLGYIGALGSRQTQADRVQWLAEQEVSPDAIERIHGPAGLAIGSFTPPEIAISIVAEILATRAAPAASGRR